jgi:hypothetical protein
MAAAVAGFARTGEECAARRTGAAVGDQPLDHRALARQISEQVHSPVHVLVSDGSAAQPCSDHTVRASASR